MISNSFSVLLIELFSSHKPTQVAELQKHNEDLIQEMDKVMTQLEKAKPGKAKKKPSDADEPSKVWLPLWLALLWLRGWTTYHEYWELTRQSTYKLHWLHVLSEPSLSTLALLEIEERWSSSIDYFNQECMMTSFFFSFSCPQQE